MSDIYKIRLKSPGSQIDYGLEDTVSRTGAPAANTGAAQTATTSQQYNVSSGNSVTLPSSAEEQNAPATWDTVAGAGTTTATQQYNISSGSSQTMPESALSQTAAVTWDTVQQSGTSTSNQQYNVTSGHSQTIPDTAQEQTVAITWDAPVASGSFVNLARTATNVPYTLASGYNQIGSQCLADAVSTAFNAGDTLLYIGFYVEITGEVSLVMGNNYNYDSTGTLTNTVTQSGWYYTFSGILTGASSTINKFYIQKTGDGTAVINYLYCQSYTWLHTNYPTYSWSTTTNNKPQTAADFKTLFGELQITPGQDSGSSQGSAAGSVTYNGSTTALTSSDSSMTVGPGAVIACSAGTLHTTVVLTTTTTTATAAATVTYNGTTTNYTNSNATMQIGPGAVVACMTGTLHLTATLTTATGGGTVTATAGATVTYNGSTASYTNSNSTLLVGPGAVIVCTSGTLHLTVALTTTQSGGTSQGSGQSSGTGEGGQTVIASAYPDWSSYKWAAVGDSLTDSTINATLKYHAIIAAKTGITVQMLGVGSTGYTAGAANGKAYIARCEQVALDTDVVTLFGSVNDWKNYANNSLCPVVGTATDAYDSTKTWQENTFCANINHTFDALFARVPTAKVIVFSAMPYYGVSVSHFKDARDALQGVCAARHIPYIDMYDSTGFYRIQDNVTYAKAYTWEGENGSWASTGDYPSSFGHPSNKAHAEIIAPIFYETLKKYLPI